MVKVSQDLDVWRSGSDEIIHTFMKSGMHSSFDKGALDVVIVQDFEGARITEENAETRIGNNLAVARSRWPDMHTASKSAQFGQIWQFGSTHFIRAGRSSPVWDKIVEAQIMVECVWLETGLKVGAG